MTRIGYIGGPQSISTGRERYDAFIDALPTARARRRPGARSPSGTSGWPAAPRRPSRLLAVTERPTALLAADNLMAEGALAAIRSQGLRIGADIEVDRVRRHRMVRPHGSARSRSSRRMPAPSAGAPSNCCSASSPARSPNQWCCQRRFIDRSGARRDDADVYRRRQPQRRPSRAGEPHSEGRRNHAGLRRSSWQRAARARTRPSRHRVPVRTPS